MRDPVNAVKRAPPQPQRHWQDRGHRI